MPQREAHQKDKNFLFRAPAGSYYACLLKYCDEYSPTVYYNLWSLQLKLNWNAWPNRKFHLLFATLTADRLPFRLKANCLRTFRDFYPNTRQSRMSTFY